MRLLTLALVASTSLTLTLPVNAQQVDQAGADILAAQIPTFIDELVENTTDIDFSYELNGPVQASPRGSFYELSIPQLDFEAGRQARGTIPPIDARVTPLSNGWQRAQFDFPSPILLSNPRQDEELRISFESQGNDLTIAPEYGMALNGVAGLTDLRVTVSESKGMITADSLGMVVETEASGAGPNSYNSTSQFEMAAISMDFEDAFSLQLGQVSIGGGSTRQRLDLFAELQDGMGGLDPESEAFVSAFVDLLRRHQDENWLGDVDISFDIRDLAFQVEGIQGSLGRFALSMSALGLDTQSADLGLVARTAGLESAAIPPLLQPIVPTDMLVDVVATDTPIEAIADELYGFLGEPAAEEDVLGPKGRRAGVGSPTADLAAIDPLVFVALMLNSDAQVEFRDVRVEAPIGYIAGNGTLSPDPAAALQAVADIDLRIAGLPDMISFAQQIGGDAAQFAGVASAIAAMGRDTTDAEGTPIKAFDLQLTAQGQVLLNGNDMSAMLGLFR